jgi:1,4-dihydroxy-2-naphthoate octaprenyltransferase
MKPRLGAALRTRKLRYFRVFASRAEASAARGSALAVFFARWLRRHEDRLFAALGGVMSFQLFRTAYDVGLFKLLHERPGLRAGEIAEALGLAAYPTEILLLGLVPMQLLWQSDRRYYNDPALSGLLSGALDDGGLGKIIEYFQDLINPAMLHLNESVRRGRPVGLHRLFGEDAGSFYEALGESEIHGVRFREAMQADTRLNRDRVARSSLFTAHRRVLDVGGNTGELAIAIAAHHPGIRITVLDFEDAAARARTRFCAEGVADRLGAIGGDLLEQDFPPGYDCVLFAHFLDIFSPDKVRRFLKRAFDCLPLGGAVCIFGSVMDDDEAGPLMYGVLSSYFLCLADGEGRFYTAEQIAEAMRDAGFVDIEKKALPRSEVVLRGVKRGAVAHGRAGGARAWAHLASFVRLGRPKFLVYSLLLYGLGSAAVVHEGRAIGAARWGHGLAFVWCAHLMTHYCNEYFDLAADSANLAPTRWTGGSRVLVDGRLRPAVSLAAACVLLFAALSLSLGMPGVVTRWVALPMLALSWFYTAPPLSLNHRGLGEVTVATVLNVLVPLLAYDVQRGEVSAPAALLGAASPVFVAQAARMLVMNLSDHEGDRRAGKRTLAVVLGPPRARCAFALASVVVYGSILALAAARTLPVAAGAAMLLTLPIAVWLSRRLLSGAPRDAGEAERIAFWASAHVALLAAAATFGLLASPLASGAHGASLALCAVILAAFGAILAMQVRRNLEAGR